MTCRTRAEAEAALAKATEDSGDTGSDASMPRRRGSCMYGRVSSFSGTRSSEEAARWPYRLQRSVAAPERAISTPIPAQKSIQHFKDQIRQRTVRKAPVTYPGANRRRSTRSFADGATTTARPMSASSSTVSTDGSCDGSGRIGTSDGDVGAGRRLPDSQALWRDGTVNLSH